VVTHVTRYGPLLRKIILPYIIIPFYIPSFINWVLSRLAMMPVSFVRISVKRKNILYIINYFVLQCNVMYVFIYTSLYTSFYNNWLLLLLTTNEEVPVWRQVPLDHDIFYSCTLALRLKCSKLKIFWISLFTHRQSCEVQNWVWSAVVLQMSYLTNPNWANKNGKRKQPQSTP
jgi:hypothetical protein